MMEALERRKRYVVGLVDVRGGRGRHLESILGRRLRPNSTPYGQPMICTLKVCQHRRWMVAFEGVMCGRERNTKLRHDKEAVLYVVKIEGSKRHSQKE